MNTIQPETNSPSKEIHRGKTSYYSIALSIVLSASIIAGVISLASATVACVAEVSFWRSVMYVGVVAMFGIVVFGSSVLLLRYILPKIYRLAEFCVAILLLGTLLPLVSGVISCFVEVPFLLTLGLVFGLLIGSVLVILAIVTIVSKCQKS